MLFCVYFLWHDPGSVDPVVLACGTPQSIQKTESQEYSGVETDT